MEEEDHDMDRRQGERREQLRGYGPDRRVAQLPFEGTDQRLEERRMGDRRQVEWRSDYKKPVIQWADRRRRAVVVLAESQTVDPMEEILSNRG